MTKPSASSCRLTLAQELRRQAKLVDRLAKSPDRGVVGRLHLQRQAAKAAKRQPIAHRLLGARIRERVPLLQKNDLGHRQRRIAWHARRRAMDRRKEIPERRPVEPLLDPVQKSSNLAKSRSPSRLRRKLGTGHDAISAKHPVKLKPRESNPPHFCKNLRTGRTAFECDRGRAGGDLLPAFTSV
jgi:hypothetical protein